MTIPGFGRVTPIQANLLRLAGYRLTRSLELNRSSIPDDERLAIMRQGRDALRQATGHDFGYDLLAWEKFLIASCSEYRHRYAFRSTHDRVAEAVRDEQRRRLVADVSPEADD